ncbi:putative phage tail protein [Clostridium sp. KNHs216]|uniref:putative phage tail protein n=1 Tax=Clostridium sp. KNHs216 TaxID=1550235 RepID=UPI001153DF50|nr:putative phage tail protein [Clostridium sp. KNHs216]TQI69015.1 uncharacterized protein DUF2313 [Clostridium sp. KNHs216]
MFYDDPADYKAYLPEPFQKVVEVDALAGTINIQIDKLSAIVKSMADNKSVSTADEDGCARWEKMLGVNAPMNATLQARRDALKAKLMTKPPINLQTLKAIVEAYMGLEVDVLVDGYTVKIRYRGESRIADLNPLIATAYEKIPANMLLDIAYLYLIWDELDIQNLTFDQLDAKNLTMTDLEKGEWI